MSLKDPKHGVRVEAALAALQAEMNLVRSSCGRFASLRGGSSSQRETVETLQIEVKRIEALAAASSGRSAIAGATPGKASAEASGGVGVVSRPELTAAEQPLKCSDAAASCDGDGDGDEEERKGILAALRAEVERLEAARDVTAKADLALESLHKRLNISSLDDGTYGEWIGSGVMDGKGSGLDRV